MANRERVAFLGLGIMGWPQAANVANAGFDLTVWNRTRTRAEQFSAEHGSHIAASAAEAAEGADVTITMVPDVPEVEEVMFGERGAAAGLREGSLAIDMSTIAPEASIAIGRRLREQRVGFLDAPVSGSRPKAEDGTLTIMVGGEAADFERAKPVLEAMGQLVVHVGPQGQGSVVKLINNTLAAVNAAALGEALLLARREGVDTGPPRRVVAASSGASTMLALKAGPMLEHDYEPLFKLEHMLKDVRHYLDEARRRGAPTELGSAAERLYAWSDRNGMGEQDFAAVMSAVEAANPAKST